MTDDTKPEAKQDNDAKIAAGLMKRYTRTCPCGSVMQFDELPGPKKCPVCAARDEDAAGKNGSPKESNSPNCSGRSLSDGGQ